MEARTWLHILTCIKYIYKSKDMQYEYTDDTSTVSNFIALTQSHWNFKL